MMQSALGKAARFGVREQAQARVRRQVCRPALPFVVLGERSMMGEVRREGGIAPDDGFQGACDMADAAAFAAAARRYDRPSGGRGRE